MKFLPLLIANAGGRIVYGERGFGNTAHEVLLVEVSNARAEAVDALKYLLHEHCGQSSSSSAAGSRLSSDQSLARTHSGGMWKCAAALSPKIATPRAPLFPHSMSSYDSPDADTPNIPLQL